MALDYRDEEWVKELRKENADMRAQITELILKNSDLSRENEAYAAGMREHITMGEETILGLQEELKEAQGHIAGLGGVLGIRKERIEKVEKQLKEARRYARMYYQRVEELEGLCREALQIAKTVDTILMGHQLVSLASRIIDVLRKEKSP